MNSKATVLVIEDEPMLLMNIAMILELHGFNVLKAPSGKEGLAIAEQNLPNLILCDVMMEGMDGFEVLKNVRSNQQLHTTPFIFLTAFADVQDKEKGMAATAQAYLTKPFVAKELVETIQKFI